MVAWTRWRCCVAYIDGAMESQGPVMVVDLKPGRELELRSNRLVAVGACCACLLPRARLMPRCLPR